MDLTSITVALDKGIRTKKKLTSSAKNTTTRSLSHTPRQSDAQKIFGCRLRSGGAALEAKITLLLLLLLLLLPSFTQKLLLLYFFALQLLSMLLSILRSMLQSML